MSCTVSKLSRIAGQIFAFDRGGCLSNAVVGGEPLNSRVRSWPTETKNVDLSYGVKSISILWTVWAWHASVIERQTDGRKDERTDMLVAKAAVYYAARSEINFVGQGFQTLEHWSIGEYWFSTKRVMFLTAQRCKVRHLLRECLSVGLSVTLVSHA